MIYYYYGFYYNFDINPTISIPFYKFGSALVNATTGIM